MYKVGKVDYRNSTAVYIFFFQNVFGSELISILTETQKEKFKGRSQFLCISELQEIYIFDFIYYVTSVDG